MLKILGLALFLLSLHFNDAVYQETKCANAGGVCMHSSQCSGRTLTGYCPTQSASVKCCIASSSGVYQEQKCANAGGTCMHSSQCSGRTLTGYCPSQSASVKCCIASSSGSVSSVSGNGCGCSANAATRCSGGPAPGARRLGQHFVNKFGGRFEIYNCRNVRGGSSLSLHAEGRAVDIFLTGATGRKAFEYAVSIACKTGIQEVIFNRRIWTSNGEHAYGGKIPHTDHVHVGLNRCGAQNWNL